MAFGIQNATNVTFNNITTIANSTKIEEFLVKADQVMFGGLYFFVMLCVLFIILYRAMQGSKDQPLNNFMYSAAICSLLGFVLRAISFTWNGTVFRLLNGWQMMFFVVIFLICLLVIWATKEN